MKSIHFNDGFAPMDTRDMISFMEYLVGNNDVEGCHVYVGKNEINKTDSPLMCEALIHFQTIKGDAINKVNTLYVFRNYRANDFCCQNMSHKEKE